MVGSISAIWGFIVVGKVNPIFRLTKVVYRDKLKKKVYCSKPNRRIKAWS